MSVHSQILKKLTLKDTASVSRFTELNQNENHVAVLKRQRNEQLIKKLLKQLCHHLMTVNQTESAVIRVDNTDHSKWMIINRWENLKILFIWCSHSLVIRLSILKICTSVSVTWFLFMSKWRCSLQHMISILQDYSLKVFQIVIICWEISVSEDHTKADMLMNSQIVSSLFYMHKDLSLTHDMLSYSTILLDLNEKVKIDRV